MGEEQYLQAGDYVSVRFSGTHREASQYYMQLLEYMDRMEYACCGGKEIVMVTKNNVCKTGKGVL